MCAEDWAVRRVKKREKRRAGAAKRRRWVPLLKVICNKYGVNLSEVPGGYQFRRAEYILTWWPSTNRIVVQFAGGGETKEFTSDTDSGEPKIFRAVRKLVGVTGSRS